MANFDFSNFDDDDDLDLGIGGDSHITNPPARHSQTPAQPVSAGNPNAHNNKRSPAAEALDALRNPREVIKKPEFLQPGQAASRPAATATRPAPQQAPPRMPAPPIRPPQSTNTQPAPVAPSMPAPPSHEDFPVNDGDYVASAAGRPTGPRTLSMPGRNAPEPEPAYEEPTYSEPAYVEPAYVEPTVEAYEEEVAETYAEPAYTPQREIPEDVYPEPDPEDFYAQVDDTNPAQDPRLSGAYDYAANFIREDEPEPAPRRTRRSSPTALFEDTEPAPDPAPRRKAVVEEDDEEEAPQKKTRGRKPVSKKPAAKSKAKERPPKKQGNYSGGRNKVLFLRIGVFAALGVLVLLGAKSILLPGSGPSKAQVMSAAQEALGQTGFPQDAGVGFATAFTKTFLTMDPTQQGQRDTQLKNYAPEEVIQSIDLRYRTDQDTITSADGTKAPALEAAPGGETTNQPTQTVTQGPYFVGAKNVDEKNSVITTLSQLNNNQWVYLQVPITYDPTTLGLAVSATPTFLSPTLLAKVPADAGDPSWQSDTEVVQAFQSDLENYLLAWSASDSNLISRYITTDATVATKTGLENTVKFSRLAELSVESVTDDSLTPNTRRAQADVVWIDPATNIVYSQSYRLVIEKQPDNRWYVKDITNLGLIPGNPTETDGVEE